jgi:hypothetical protein
MSPHAGRKTCSTQVDAPCRTLLASVLLVALISAQHVSAASVSLAERVNAAPNHCKCGAKCHGQSCCCGSHEALDRFPGSEPTPDSDHADNSPCSMNSAPCSDSGLPNAPSEESSTKSAALKMVGHPRPVTVGILLPFSTLSLRPTRPTSRLDRPPECLHSA